MASCPVTQGLAAGGATVRSGRPEGDGGSGTLVVFASAWSTDNFTELGEESKAEHPDVEGLLVFSSAGELVAQMMQGAPESP